MADTCADHRANRRVVPDANIDGGRSMNVLDLPWYVILAGWLWRRLTKPANVSSFSTPDETWRATRDAVDSIYRDRKLPPRMRGEPRWLLYDILWNYKLDQLRQLGKLRDMGISFVAIIRKEKVE